MKSDLLVIGYGNELRGDDGVGPAAARAVAGWNRPGIVALDVHQLTPELADDVGQAGYVVFVDAGATIGTIIAAYGLGWQQSSLALWPILWGVALDHESVVGGTSVVGTVTLLNPAPPGGVAVALVNNDSDLITLPPTVVIPEGGTGAAFNVLTAPISVPTRVSIDSGTAFEGYVPKTRVLRSEMAVAMANGLGTDRALRAVTIDAAKLLGIDNEYGTIAVGKRADLVLYDGDPFENATHITHTFIDGKLVWDRADYLALPFARRALPIAGGGGAACCMGQW